VSQLATAWTWIAEAVHEIHGTSVNKVSNDGTVLVIAGTGCRPVARYSAGPRRPKACYQERCEGEHE
jgi:hypothetical protein